VLDAGRIVERGRHDALLAAGGLYQELYETQYAGRRPSRPPPADEPDRPSDRLRTGTI